MLYMDSGLLKAQRFDLQRLQLEGSSIPITDRALAISASTNGTLAYRTAIAARTQLTWFDRRGTRLGTLGSPGRYESVVCHRTTPESRSHGTQISGRPILYAETNSLNLPL